jgi:hypothetical protein
VWLAKYIASAKPVFQAFTGFGIAGIGKPSFGIGMGSILGSRIDEAETDDGGERRFCGESHRFYTVVYS